jgi:hypothetical protein
LSKIGKIIEIQLMRRLTGKRQLGRAQETGQPRYLPEMNFPHIQGVIFLLGDPWKRRRGMDPLTTGVGVLVFVYGVFGGIMRFLKPALFRKLVPMQQKFGPAAGSAIHFFSYVIVPLAVGVYLVKVGLNGGSLS